MKVTVRQKIVRIGLFALLFVSLAALMYMPFRGQSEKTQNARTLAVLQQYMNALELIQLDMNGYPGGQEFVCLGDYEDNYCWDNEGTHISENEAFNTALMQYVPLLSAGPIIVDSKNPTATREGYVYRRLRNGGGYEIQYPLYGSNASCGFGRELTLDVTKESQNEYTLCTIIR